MLNLPIVGGITMEALAVLHTRHMLLSNTSNIFTQMVNQHPPIVGGIIIMESMLLTRPAIIKHLEEFLPDAKAAQQQHME